MNKKNEIIKLNENSVTKINNRVTVFNKQIIKSSNRLADRFYKEAEYLTWRFRREDNYNGDKVEDAKKANELFLKAIELNPKFEDAYNGYAQNLRLTFKEYNIAIEIYTKLIELNPKYEYAISRRGICKRELKDYEGYLEDFNKSISVNGGEMEIGDYITRSIIKRSLKDFYGVIDDLLEAIKLGEIDSFDYEKLGQAYIEIGNLEKSFEFFDKAIEAELNKTDIKNRNVPFPLLYRVYDLYISSLMKIGNNRKASKLLMEMKLHFPEKIRTIELINELGIKLMSLGDVEINDDERNVVIDYLDNLKI